jgi:hypothetical protein
MITCKTCKKFAKLDNTIINGLDEVLLIGSCKHCGYKEEPVLPANFTGSMIRDLESRIDYDDFEELGIDR